MPHSDGRLADLSLALLVVLLFRSVPAAAGAQLPAEPRRPAAAELRLPADIVYRRAVGPDRAVVFRHTSHVALEHDRCTGCHPGLFPILHRGPEPSPRAMNAGGSCGACHDGRKAFAVRDTASCAACHSGMPTRRMAAGSGTGAAAGAPPTAALPRPHAYPRGADSPGLVTFRHSTHARGPGSCRSCHPRPFRMSAASPLPNGGMHERSGCGLCHDGQRAFAAEDPGACARCHVGAGASP